MIDHRVILLGTVLVGLVGGKALLNSSSGSNNSNSSTGQMLTYPSSGGATLGGGGSGGGSSSLSNSGQAMNSLLNAIDTTSSNIPKLQPIKLSPSSYKPVLSGPFTFFAPPGPPPRNLVSQTVGLIPLVGGLLQPATNYLWSNKSVINPFGNNYLGGALNFGTGHLLGINQPFGKMSIINPFGSNFLGGVPAKFASGVQSAVSGAVNTIASAGGSMSVVNPFGHNFLGGIFNGL